MTTRNPRDFPREVLETDLPRLEPLPDQEFLTTSLFKFIIRSEPESEADTMFFPAVALVVAYNEAHAISLLLQYCKREQLVDRRYWEWLFECDVVRMPVTEPTTCVFVTL